MSTGSWRCPHVTTLVVEALISFPYGKGSYGYPRSHSKQITHGSWLQPSAEWSVKGWNVSWDFYGCRMFEEANISQSVDRDGQPTKGGKEVRNLQDLDWIFLETEMSDLELICLGLFTIWCPVFLWYNWLHSFRILFYTRMKSFTFCIWCISSRDYGGIYP